MLKQFLPRAPYVAAPMLLAAGFITTLAVVGDNGAASRKLHSLGGAKPRESEVKELPPAKLPDMLAIFDYLNDTVVSRTKNHIYPARSAVETASRMLGKHTSICDDPFIEQYCVDVLNLYRQIDNFYIADPGGSRIMSSRQPDGIETDIIDRRGEEPIYVRKRGQRVVSRRTEKELVAASGEKAVYDPRVRPWYLKTEQEKTICWSDVYIFATGSGDQQPGFTVSAPTFGPEGELLFITAADFVVSNFSNFLRDLKVGERGIALLMNENEELIGFPDPAKVIRRQGDQVSLARAGDALPEYGKAAIDKWKSGKEKIFFYEHEKVRHIAYFSPFMQSCGNAWWMGVIVPADEFFNLEANRTGAD